jgi:hypothetical protein
MAARLPNPVSEVTLPLVFQFTALNFWNSLKRPCSCPHSDTQLGGDLPYAEALCPELSYSIAVEYRSRLYIPVTGLQDRNSHERTRLASPATVPIGSELYRSRAEGIPQQTDLPCSLRRNSSYGLRAVARMDLRSHAPRNIRPPESFAS